MMQIVFLYLSLLFLLPLAGCNSHEGVKQNQNVIQCPQHWAMPVVTHFEPPKGMETDSFKVISVSQTISSDGIRAQQLREFVSGSKPVNFLTDSIKYYSFKDETLRFSLYRLISGAPLHKPERFYFSHDTLVYQSYPAIASPCSEEVLMQFDLVIQLKKAMLPHYYKLTGRISLPSGRVIEE